VNGQRPPVATQLSFTESATVNSRARLAGAALHCSVSPFGKLESKRKGA